ncbi:MAG: UDP-N-acetylglucosamine 2-epimerase (non-hydrolyzing) [Saprospiraceae bacterium]|nr:UDP-N-acetylglucosamine 2-epimerase (non-hydrolyzing) [Saprospiraceae bacterium]
MKIITVIGARPQFVKAAVVSRAFRAYPSIEEKIVHTGQHFDANMSDIFFEEMEIPRPHFNLEINSLSHGAMTGRMLEHIEEVLLAEKPDALLVYGDTNSTLAGALAARKLQIPVMHVEAGLRSHNNAMPEETNRILTDRISKVLFCPTKTAVTNLQLEGFEHFDCSILQVGDVMEDAAIYYAPRSTKHSNILKTLHLEGTDFALCTLHRAENTDDPARFRAIVEALNETATRMPVVLPLHPRTQKLLEKNGLQINAITVPPLGYFDMLSLLQHCCVVMTDSGGLQKEAYFFGKFCLTLRDDTEWTELVEEGFNFLVGADKNLILNTLEGVFSKKFPEKKDFFGGGKASARIAEVVANYLV